MSDAPETPIKRSDKEWKEELPAEITTRIKIAQQNPMATIAFNKESLQPTIRETKRKLPATDNFTGRRSKDKIRGGEIWRVAEADGRLALSGASPKCLRSKESATYETRSRGGLL